MLAIPFRMDGPLFIFRFQQHVFYPPFFLFSNSCRRNVIVPTDILVLLFYILRHQPFRIAFKTRQRLLVPFCTHSSLHLDECLPPSNCRIVKACPAQKCKERKREVIVLMSFSIQDRPPR
jgi:hypothetical protein